MPKKTMIHDSALHLEAYRFTGLAQPFPSHFHAYFVVGLIESGTRELTCLGNRYSALPGDLLLFHPGEPHACTQSGGGLLDYRALNLPPPLLQSVAESSSVGELPRFSQNVLRDDDLACSFRALHIRLLDGSFACELEKEESLCLFLTRLLHHEASSPMAPLSDTDNLVKRLCAYLETHFAEHITLDQLCRHAGLSKSTLLRVFTRGKGMTPYRYLESVRVNHAKVLLEKGVSPAEAAQRGGFSDQSHLTRYFSRFLGLTPGAYRDIFQEIPPNETL